MELFLDQEAYPTMRNNLEDKTNLPEPFAYSVFYGQTPLAKDSAVLSQRSLLGLDSEDKSLLLTNTEQKNTKAALGLLNEAERSEKVEQGAQPA